MTTPDQAKAAGKKVLKARIESNVQDLIADVEKEIADQSSRDATQIVVDTDGYEDAAIQRVMKMYQDAHWIVTTSHSTQTGNSIILRAP